MFDSVPEAISHVHEHADAHSQKLKTKVITCTPEQVRTRSAVVFSNPFYSLAHRMFKATRRRPTWPPPS
jgi:hypothetical protein